VKTPYDTSIPAQRSKRLLHYPPYTAGGKKAASRLYAHSDICRVNLFSLASEVKGPVTMTYDDCDEVSAMADSHGLACARVPMKNTHHSVMHELLITNSTALFEQQRRHQLAQQLASANG
jgi:hypothetical protein